MIPLIAAALYGMAGHQNNERRKRDDARQNMLDTRDGETHNAKMAQESDRVAEVQREKDFRDANSAALSAGKLDQGQQVMDSAGSNAFTKDPQAAAMMGDMAESKNGGASVVDAARVSTGRQGATMGGTVAGNQVITDPIQAQAFAKTQTMGEWAKMKARKDVADQFGKMEVSDAIQGKLATLEGEGAFKALAMAKAGDFAGAAAHYGATGNDRLPDGATFDSVETTDPITKQPRQTIRMVGKDGKPLIADMDQAFRSYLTPVQQYTMTKGDTDTALTERRTTVAEKQADTAARNQAATERKIDFLVSGGNQPIAPIWDSKADDFLRERYTAKDPNTGVIGVDGNGMQFAKALSMAKVRENGGDTTSAMGRAFEIDSQLKAKVGEDPAKLAAARKKYLEAIQKAPAPSAPAAGGLGGAPISYKDPLWNGAESAAAEKIGVPVELLRSIRINGERSNGDQVSSKGAKGVYQFTQSSRDAFLKKYGVDAYSQDPNEQAIAAAFHLKESLGRNKGDMSKAVAGYNGGISGERGTNNSTENKSYVNRVMGGMGDFFAARPSKSPRSMGDDFQSPGARAALQQRVQEASNGGAALSDIEAKRARQLQLIS